MTWKDHIYGNENIEELGLLKKLSKVVGVLKKLKKLLPTPKFRQVVAAIFTSKMTYGMTVWGGIWGLPNSDNSRHTAITKESMRKLQILQNKVMRIETGLDHQTSSQVLLNQCQYLSVHQLVAFHSGCQAFKIIQSKLPVYHTNRLVELEENLRTRNSGVKRIDFDLSLARSSFFYQSSKLWSTIPSEIRNLKTITNFKKHFKNWVRNHIAIKPG